MMMCLGLFVFSLDTAAYQELQRQTEWKHPSTSRVGARDAYQFTGPGDDTITLSGWIAPELTGSIFSLDALRSMADSGQAWIMVQGTGRVYGTYVITAMTEGKTMFDKRGDPRRLEFSLTLKRTDEGLLSLLAGLGNLSQLGDLMGLSALGNLARDATSAASSVAGMLDRGVGGIVDNLPLP